MKLRTIICITSILLVLLSVSCGKNKKTANTQSAKIATTAISNTSQVAKKEAPDKAHNSKNSININGTYEGVLPCADCEGIKTQIVLKSDRYRMKKQYKGSRVNKRGIFESEGGFTWNNKGTIITFEANKDDDVPTKYMVGENALYCLDMDGNRITGSLAEHYILKKISK